MSGHGSVPFFCPYCGDEEIRPYGETHGEWRCDSCRRAFALRTVNQALLADRRTTQNQDVPPDRRTTQNQDVPPDRRTTPEPEVSR